MDQGNPLRQLHRSVHPLDFGRARDNEPARIPQWHPASTRYGLTKYPATNQRATRRDRTNDCMCHLDHLLRLLWAHHRRVPPTEAARPKSILRMTSIAALVKISRREITETPPYSLAAAYDDRR